MSSCYKILGVSPSDSEKAVKKSYKRLCRLYHPDSGNGDVKKFMEVQDAWKEVCSIGFDTGGSWSHKTLFDVVYSK